MGGQRSRPLMTAIHNALVGAQEDAVTLTVSAVPSSVAKITTTSSTTTGFCTASASGGSGSYSYSWAKLTNDYPDLVIDSTISPTTTFSASGQPSGEAWFDTVRCTATDIANPSVTGFINVLVSIVRL